MTAADVNIVIEKICEKLELPAQKGFEYVVMFGVREIAVAATSVMGIALFATLARFFFNASQKGKRALEDVYAAASILCTIGVVLLSWVLFFIVLPDVVLYFHSPEAWAVRYLLQVVAK